VDYESGDDPRLLDDLRTALKRWHRATLGNLPLALCLGNVERRLAADPRLTRTTALHETIRAALLQLHNSGQAEYAQLLERRYLQELGMYRLQETYHLGERSLYYRLEEATVALAQALWVMEQEEEGPARPLHAPAEPSLAGWRARHLPPPTYTHLFGVDDALAQLLARLNDRDGHWMVALDGMGGLGKTALARRAAGCLAETDRFADIAWLAFKHDSYPVHTPEPTDRTILTCAELLEGIGRQLAGAGLAPLPFETKRKRVRALLQSRPFLVVVDNLETVLGCGDLPGWFWELANPSKFLFTSRHRIEQDTGLSILLLDQLAERDAMALIRHEGHQRGLQEVAGASDDALLPILAVTGGNPLAIKLVVGQLVTLPLNRVLEGLQTIGPGSDSLYQYLYGTAWDLLSDSARDLLSRIASLPKDGVTWDELSAVTSLHDGQLASAIGELTTYSLVQATGLEQKTYCLHPLTHHFVLGRCAQSAAASLTKL
jgi:hypothetical protein